MKRPLSPIDLEKNRIIKWIQTVEDSSVLDRVKYVMASNSSADWWDDLSTEEKNAIDEGLADIKAGKVTSHDEARKRYQKWL